MFVQRLVSRFVVLALVAVVLVGVQGAVEPVPAGAAGATVVAPVSVTFAYTGSVQSYTVPDGVTGVFVEAWGGVGGCEGGGGGTARGLLRVSPGEILKVHVGAKGVSSYYQYGGYTSPGYSGCDGGRAGATDIRLGGDGLLDRAIVAGGGGGGANEQRFFPFQAFKAWGGAGGQNGGDGGGGGGNGGYGGTQTAAGDSFCGLGYPHGESAWCPNPLGFGVGEGNGGDGWYGGGNGYSTVYCPSICMGNIGAGGGGSSHVAPSAFYPLNQTQDPGSLDGNGLVHITPGEPPFPPSPPIMGIATRGNASVSVAFAAASDGLSPILKFTATCVSSNGGLAGSAEGNSSPVVVSRLTNGTPYTCRVTAMNALGASGESAQSNVVIPAGVPGAPTSVAAVPGSHRATVSWVAPVNNRGSAVTGYVVTPYFEGVAQPERVYASTATTQVLILYQNGGFTFRVAAVNDVGRGPMSLPSALIMPGLPLAPTNVIGTGAVSSARVSWTAPTSNGGSAITGYQITPYKVGVAQTAGAFATTQLFQNISGLTNGVQYTFKVAALNANGTGLVSLPNTPITIGNPQVPSAPQMPIGAHGSAQVALSWKAPVSNGSANVIGYLVTPYKAGVAQPVRAYNANTTQTVTGLTNGSTYTFKVAASNAAGTSIQSVATVPVTVGAPVAPRTVKAVPVTTAVATGSLTVTFTAPANNGAAITGYGVTCVSSNLGVTRTASLAGAVAAPVTVTGLTTAKTYTCTVTATNSRGTSPAGTSASVIVGAPAAPTGLTVTKVASGQLRVAFTAGANNGSPITSYGVTCTSSNGGATGSITGAASPLTVIGLTAAKTYTCSVRATNARGNSLTVTTLAVVA